MLVPSKATPAGAFFTSKVSSVAPSLARSLRTVFPPLFATQMLEPSKAHFDAVIADKTETIIAVTSLTRFAHRCRNVASEALWAKRLVSVCFVIPERSPELVLVTLKA